MKYIPVITKILKKYGVVEAAIFGSVARGEAKAGSDLDILVTLPKKKINLFQYIRMQNELTDGLGIKVELTERNHLKERIKPDVMQDLVAIPL